MGVPLVEFSEPVEGLRISFSRTSIQQLIMVKPLSKKYLCN